MIKLFFFTNKSLDDIIDIGGCMKKVILKIIISILVIVPCIYILYVNISKLTKVLEPWELTFNENSVSPSIKVSEYLNSEEYKFKKYLDTAISYMQAEDKNPSSSQVQKYLNLFNEESGAWCTEFVIWSLVQADNELGTNYVKDKYPFLDSGYKSANWFKKRDRLHTEEAYIPKRGDMMFFQYYDSIIDHTAFVLGTKEEDGITYVLTIEGNIPSLKDKGIKERTIPLTDKYIYGYGSYE